uniref:nucleotidyltransferase family protein n=1 Tax=uncultured Lamprocystis sp. TaxID=543132 RepID=UPI0025E52A0A
MSSAPSRRWRALAALLAPAEIVAERPAVVPIEDWRALYGMATAHLVAPSLYAGRQAWDERASVPEDVREALACLYLLNDDRNRRLRRVLRETVAILNQADIVPVLLKGAIALLPDQYPLAFARVLGDLDLGVPADQVDRGEAALRAAGYFPAPHAEPVLWSAASAHHLLPLFHPSGDGYVEVHYDLFSRAPQQAALPLAVVLARAETLDWEGLRIRIPALADRLLHNALHHQVQDR